jgi:hypothetical protein
MFQNFSDYNTEILNWTHVVVKPEQSEIKQSSKCVPYVDPP